MGGISLRKSSKRLKARLKAFDTHGENPTTNNPGKQQGMLMHRPGSLTK